MPVYYASLKRAKLGIPKSFFVAKNPIEHGMGFRMRIDYLFHERFCKTHLYYLKLMSSEPSYHYNHKYRKSIYTSLDVFPQDLVPHATKSSSAG